MKKIVLIVLVVLLFVSALAFVHTKRSLLALRDNLSEQEESLRKFKQDSEVDPGSEAIEKMEQAIAAKEQKLEKLLSVMDSKDKQIPGDVSDKGIYFFESLYATTKSLERKATAKKMIIPAVNFSVDIPEEDDIPYLLKQVEMIDEVMGIIIDAGNCDLESVAPLPLDSQDTVLGFVKLGIQLSMRIEPDSFVKVLSGINSRIPLYLVEKLSVKSQEEDGRLRANFTVSRLITGSTLSEVPEFKGKDVTSLDAIYPLDFKFSSFDERNPFFEYAEVVEQPQRAGPVKPAPKQAAIVGPQFTYKGTISMNKKVIGIIEDNWKKSACFVAEGDVCSGYEILKIEDKKAILFKDDKEIEVTKGDSNA